MDKRTTGMLWVVITTLLCGLPGLAAFCFGSLAFVGVFIPDTSVDPADKSLVIGTSIGMVCLGFAFLAIPIVIGYFTHRKELSKLFEIDEPLPENDF